MYTWFSDLDNTLVYSHRNFFPAEKVLVELLMGKEQSYMTKITYDFMCNMKMNFVPVTTRTIEQYNRLFIFQGSINVKRALVCNGAILLVDGHIDEEWKNETRHTAHKGISELLDIQKDFSEYNINNVEDFMFYFEAEKPEEQAEIYRERYKSMNIYVGYDKRKVYFVPTEINKGTAIYRYCQRYGIEKSISSGDSEFDVSMLSATNISIAPDVLMKNIASCVKKYSLGDGVIISDAICKYLKIIVEENRDELKKRML